MDSLIKFPSAFSLPPSIIKLTQAFWLLDHEDWEDSVSIMLDPLLSEDDLTPDHHRAVLVSLLAQGQHSLALKYTRIRRPPVITSDDISLHISVLLSNGAIQEAFTFQRTRRSSNLLPLFYTKAEELGKLDSVLQFQEAMQLNMSQKTLGIGGTSAKDAIMSRYNDILPGVASTLANKRVTLLPSAPNKVNRPVPLSVTLQDR